MASRSAASGRRLSLSSVLVHPKRVAASISPLLVSRTVRVADVLHASGARPTGVSATKTRAVPRAQPSQRQPRTGMGCDHHIDGADLHRAAKPPSLGGNQWSLFLVRTALDKIGVLSFLHHPRYCQQANSEVGREHRGITQQWRAKCTPAGVEHMTNVATGAAIGGYSRCQQAQPGAWCARAAVAAMAAFVQEGQSRVYAEQPTHAHPDGTVSEGRRGRSKQKCKIRKRVEASSRCPRRPCAST